MRRARAGMAVHCEAMAGFVDAGAEVFDYGNSLRAGAVDGGLARDRAFSYPGFVPAYLRPLFCEGMGPFRWVALSGDPADIAATDAAVRRAFPDDDGLQRWLRLAAERVPFQGLPARICWLGYGQRDAAGLAFNDLVRPGRGRRPDRHRPGPPRLRLGRLPLPGDRGDGRRLRRHRRLAHPQRPAQRGQRRRLGRRPPRRRRRHGPLHPLRRPGGGRRHRRRRPAALPRAAQRPRHRRRPPRRRRLPAGGGGGPRARRADAACSMLARTPDAHVADAVDAATAAACWCATPRRSSPARATGRPTSGSIERGRGAHRGGKVCLGRAGGRPAERARRRRGTRRRRRLRAARLRRRPHPPGLRRRPGRRAPGPAARATGTRPAGS